MQKEQQWIGTFTYNRSSNIIGTKLVSYGYKDNNTNLVHQVDIMFTENIKYSEFMYYSPDYTKNESKI